MLRVAALLAVIAVGLTVWCLVEAASAPESRVRRLPKVVWIVLILLVPFIAPIAWLLVGRPSAAAERAAAAAAFEEFERPGRLDDPTTASDPVRDAAYRDMLRRRAEEQRRRYEQQQDTSSEPEPE